MKELEEKIGGNYDDLINELMEIRKMLNNSYSECATHLSQQIVEELLEDFDNLLIKYENEKDIELVSAIDE